MSKWRSALAVLGHFPLSRRILNRYTNHFRYDWRFAVFMPGNLSRYRLSYEHRLFTSSMASR